MTAPLSANAPLPARQRRGGLVQEVVHYLQQLIQSGQLKPGDKLPTESAVMGELSVSRTVVREAISRLQASGQVETRHGIGTFVLEAPTTHNFRIAEQDMATIDDVIAVLELRISLETEAAGLAAQRATPDQLTAMANALHGFASAIHSQSDAVPSDFQFHMEVAQATGNRHFADLMTYLGTHIIPRTRIKTADQAPEGRQAYLERVHGEHESIYNAIRNHDIEAARAAMRTHLSNSRDRLRKARDSAS
ncbi:MAG: FadR family transcriptional regulator [Limnohabitans sp.]|nr:MAG: FadR family transcriptional regulator [Limnohabitans sp.]